MNNDPLFFVDPNGKELYIFGEDEESRKKAFELLQQFVGEGADRLTLGENGRVLINTEDYKYGSNKALDLLIDIDQAVDAEGNTIKIGFGVSTKEISPEDISANNEVRGGGIVNASVTPRAGVGPDRRPDLPLGYPPGPKPTHGFQGEVTISTHVEWSINGKPIARSQIVGHELSENLYRTRDKLNYWVAHAIANLKFFGGDFRRRISARPIR
ncbi:MAG: hypothetical protein D6748_16230 [Calditrichaeota bacterium]|nr:MAG: hypothetical protein D6748_16230 [Calditrichota bacterium]